MFTYIFTYIPLILAFLEISCYPATLDHLNSGYEYFHFYVEHLARPKSHGYNSAFQYSCFCTDYISLLLCFHIPYLVELQFVIAP
jgi:hypothetical protein